MSESCCIVYGQNQITALKLEMIFKVKGYKALYTKSLYAIKEHIATYPQDLLFILVEIDQSVESIANIANVKAMTDSIPIIAISGEPKMDFLMKVIAAGAVDFLVKPLEEALVLEKITKVLRNKIVVQLQLSNGNSDLLKSEFAKSKKGKYSLSLGLIRIFRPGFTYNMQLEQKY